MRVFTYITSQFIHRILLFLEHWYVGGASVVYNFGREVIDKLDGIFAVKITLRNFFKPLFQDRTFVGYVLGFIFRSFRILIGGVAYIVVALVVLFIYLAWAVIPTFVILKIIQELFVY